MGAVGFGFGGPGVVGRRAAAAGVGAPAERVSGVRLDAAPVPVRAARGHCRARLELGDTTGAIDALIRANRLLDAWRATVSNADVRVLAFQTTDLTGEVDAGYSAVIAATALSGRMPTAFALAERRRARELIDQIHRASALQPSSGALASTGPSPIPADVMRRHA